MFDEFSSQLDLCSSCPKLCQSACPVVTHTGNESHSPWGLMQTMNMVRKGQIPFDEEVAALSYQCLTCRGCTDLCEHSNDVPAVMHEARKKAVDDDLAPSEISGFLGKFHKYNNPFSKDLLLKLESLVKEEYLESEFQNIYFPSCTTIAKATDVIQDTFQLFEKLKIDFVGVYPETIQCCGYPLIAAGMEQEFVDIAEINYHALKKYKTIISGSPACVYTLKETYKKYDFDLKDKVMTINQFIEPYLSNINFRLKKSFRTRVMYHDPCYLSRYLGEVDLPREMIGEVVGYEPLEFHHHGKQGGCSGQGGCYSVIAKDSSDEITKDYLEEVYERKENMIVTQCPSCIHKFRKNSRRLVVKDLISYLNDCIEGTE